MKGIVIYYRHFFFFFFFFFFNPFITATGRLAAERELQIYAVNLYSITALKYASTLISD